MLAGGYVSNLDSVHEIVCNMFGAGALKEECISVLVACWSQYGHTFWVCVTRCAFSMVNLWVGIN